MINTSAYVTVKLRSGLTADTVTPIACPIRVLDAGEIVSLLFIWEGSLSPVPLVVLVWNYSDPLVCPYTGCVEQQLKLHPQILDHQESRYPGLRSLLRSPACPGT